MLTNKTFVKKTKKGGVVKVVREHYLRDDIGCGSERCTECPQDGIGRLARMPESISDMVSSSHYILPDTNVFMHQMDVLSDPVFKNVIILQTVLREMRHRHSSNLSRLKELMGNPDRYFYTFTNEHHKETYVERLPKESANDYNDRVIRVAAKWYSQHLKGLVDVVLITNDKGNMEKAQEDGIKFAFTMYDYVKSFTGHPDLLDKLARMDHSNAAGDIVADRKCADLYPEHWSLAKIQSGIKSGQVIQGKFHSSRYNYLEGYIFTNDEETNKILLHGRTHLNRAVHEDIVAVELLPKDKWVSPSQVVLQDTAEEPEETSVQDEKDEKLLKKTSKSLKDLQPTGRVVGVVKRNWRPYCGILKPNTVTDSIHHLFVPAERCIPFIRIETRQAAQLAGQRLVISIDGWPKDSKYPRGHYVRSLGAIGDRDTENQVLLLEHDVPHHPFSQAVLACLPKLPWLITPKDEAERVDLRHVAICSVDPPGCTDIDDALHCRPLGNGLFDVGVHIADVSHFIRPGTAIDKEASERGTTVYLVDQRIDMVPELLSSNLCSLLSNQERFAFSCVWTLNSNAEILETRFHKSIINSRAALTYAEAQMRIDDLSQNDEVTISLRHLNNLAKILKAQRIENGALTLASSEVRFNLDSETHDPIDVQSKQLLETNSMVEEFMLLANMSSAARILEEFPDCALLRRHPAPPQGNFEELEKAFKSKGFEVRTSKGKELAESLDKASDPRNAYFNVMLRMVATRCMSQAVYFSSGTLPKEQFMHYGLAVPLYTHFTSPIRRYSDIIVHRLLAVAIQADVTYPDLLDKHKTQNLCTNLNFRHKMGQYAGRASVALYTIVYYNNQEGLEQGYVLFVRANALQILLPRIGLEATMYLDTVPDVKFTFDQSVPNQSAQGVTLSQFDPVTVLVTIDKKDIQHQKIVLKLVKPQIPGFSVTPSPVALKKKLKTS